MNLQKRFHWLLACFLLVCTSLSAEEETPRKAVSKAIEAGDLSKVRSLIESASVGVDELTKDYDTKSPLLEAASKAQIPIMKYLLEKGACIGGVSEKRDSPLVKFIQAGNRVPSQQLVETVRFLIDAGADVNGAGKDKYTALMAACEHTRYPELVELLINKGAYLDAKSDDESTPYMLALRSNNVKAYRLLIDSGVNQQVTWKGMTPLSMLAWEGNIPMAKLLLDEGKANVNSYDSIGATPLIAAAISGQTGMIQFLLEKGATINARTINIVRVQIHKNYLSIGKTYVQFPAGSTALNFAKTMSMHAASNLLADLGGVTYFEVEYKEQSSWF